MYENDLIERIKKEIPTELSRHVIELRHSEGLYRHWRCGVPGDSNRHFHIVTWPGSLCYTGDMGDYLFQRAPDMVAFMRGSAMSYGYAAEKCVAHDGRLKEFREEVMEEVLNERLGEEDDEGQEKIRDKIREIQTEFNNYSHGHDAIRAMYESDLWDGCDIPSCEAYTYHFLWCLHAIKWFCDTVQEPVVASPEAATVQR